MIRWSYHQVLSVWAWCFQHNTASQSYEEQLPPFRNRKCCANWDEDAIEIAQSISSGWLQTSPFSVFLCELLTQKVMFMVDIWKQGILLQWVIVFPCRWPWGYIPHETHLCDTFEAATGDKSQGKRTQQWCCRCFCGWEDVWGQYMATLVCARLAHE